jgi:hypothetical protein
VLDAEPELRFEIPGPSAWPFLLALATAETFIVGIFTPWAFPVGVVLAAAVFTAWFFGDPNYENKTEKDEQQSEAAAPPAGLQPEKA